MRPLRASTAAARNVPMSEWRGRAATRGNDRVAILAGADAGAIEALLERGGDYVALEAEQLVEGIVSSELAAAIITSEALRALDVATLAGAVAAQPPWSDFPILLVADRGALASVGAAVEELGQVSILERPLDKAILRNAVRAALRSRRRQREAEAYLMQREVAEERLRQVTATLELRVRERMSELRAAHDGWCARRRNGRWRSKRCGRARSCTATRSSSASSSPGPPMRRDG